MRCSAVALLAVLIASCGGQPPPQPAVAPAVVVAAPPGSALTVMAEPATDFDPQAPPSGSAVVASLDPEKASMMLSAIVSGLGPSERMMLERFLPEAGRALLSQHAASALGIDSHRPIRLGMALTAEGRGVLESLRRMQVAGEEQPGIAQEIETALGERPAPKLQVRVSVPVLEPSVLLGTLQSLLEQEGWQSHPAPAGYQSSWTEGTAALLIASRQGHLVFDLYVGSSVRGERLANAAAQGARQGLSAKPDPAPLLEGHGLRISFVPERVAEFGFVEGLTKASKAMAGVDSPVRDRLMSEGWREASRNFALARNGRGAFFESVDITADANGILPSVQGRAEPGPGLQRASVSCTPSASLEFPGADAWFDTSSACMTSLSGPGDRYSPAYAPTDFLSWVREAGWSGNLVAMPFHIMSPGRSALRDAPGIGPEAALKMERFGLVVFASGPDVFWGLLPSGTPAGDAACAHEGKSGCKTKLVAGTTVKLGDVWGRLWKVSGRWVVTSSRDKQALESLSLRLGSSGVAPVRGGVSGAAIARELRGTPLAAQAVGYGAQVRVEADGTLGVSIAPSP
jgi:hypothetical protein